MDNQMKANPDKCHFIRSTYDTVKVLEYLQKTKTLKMTFFMSRNITDAQKRVRDFHKSDALAQTNQIKYDCFFMHGTENIKKLFSQDL